VIPLAYTRAMTDLLEGASVSNQLPRVRRMLKILERAGFVRYTASAWYLTDAGVHHVHGDYHDATT